MSWKESSMICVSVAEPTRERCLAALEGIDFAEVRIDRLADPSEDDVRAIFSRGRRLVATCRPCALPESARKALLLTAIGFGAAYIDVEIEAPKDHKKALVEAARRTGCRTIVSYHDFVKTPSRSELGAIVDRCFESGADVAKIACLAESERDNARLLGLLDDPRPLAVIGLGRAGAKTRVMAPLLGAAFTYASPGEGRETAAGQVPAARLEALIKTIQEV